MMDIAATSQPKNKVRAQKLVRPGTFQQPRSSTMKQSLAVFDSQEKRFRPKGLQTYNIQAGTNNQVGPDPTLT